MEEWEDFFVRFCLDNGYISALEVTSLMSRINQAKQQNRHQDFLTLFAEELHWTDEQVQSVYLQALKHQKTRPGHDSPKEKGSARVSDYGLMAASDLVSPDIVERQLGQAMASGVPTGEGEPDRMSRMQARLSGIISEQVLEQQLSQALQEKAPPAIHQNHPSRIRPGTTSGISKERLGGTDQGWLLPTFHEQEAGSGIWALTPWIQAQAGWESLSGEPFWACKKPEPSRVL